MPKKRKKKQDPSLAIGVILLLGTYVVAWYSAKTGPPPRG